MLKTFFLVLILLCHNPSSAISNGDKVPQKKNGLEHPGRYSTVALVREYRPGKLKVFCTGSIISEQLILTARHCLFDFAKKSDRQKREMKVYFGGTDKNIRPELIREIAEVKHVKTDGDWRDYFPNLDVAWLRIQGGLPNQKNEFPDLARFRPIEILRSPERLTPQKKITLVGYGDKNPNPHQIDVGDKRTADVDFVEYIFNPQFFNLLLLDSDNGQGACHGDSGGPAYAFLDGKWYLVGVTNGFDLTVTPEALKETHDDFIPMIAHCDSGQVVYNFAGYFVDWIIETSGEQLLQSPANKEGLFPRMEPMNRDEKELSFSEWCSRTVYKDPHWRTVKQLLIFATKNKSKNETDRDVIFNCRRAEDILSQVESLKFESHDLLSTWAPISSLKKLKRIEILGKNVNQMDFSELLGSQLEALKIHPVGKKHMEQSLSSLEALQPLKDLKTLKKLDLSRQRLHTLDGLEDWKYLETFIADNNQISEIDSLLKNNNLQTVSLAGNQVEEFGFIEIGLNRLKSLDLSRNPLKSLPKLKSPGRLKAMDLSSTSLQKVDGISQFKNLEKLNLSFVEIALSSMDEISQLHRLKELSLNSVGLFSLDFIFNFKELESLSVANNQISRASVFERRAFPKMTQLMIAGNQLKSLRDFAQLPKKTSFWFGNNPVSSGAVAITSESCPLQRGPERLVRWCQRKINP